MPSTPSMYGQSPALHPSQALDPSSSSKHGPCATPSHLDPSPLQKGRHASLYIPKIIRDRAIADPIHCGLDVPSLAWQSGHSWARDVRAGMSTMDSADRHSYASRVASAGPWDASSMSELAAKFCERAADGDETHLQSVALFARELSDMFRQSQGADCASMFEGHLKQCLLAEYRAWWLPSLPSSVARIPACSPSPPHPSPDYLLSRARTVNAFAADLFAQKVVTGSFIGLCLQILTETTTFIEEVHAIRDMLTRAGVHLYERIPIKDIIGKLEQRVSMIPDGGPSCSVAQHPYPTGEVWRTVHDIHGIIANWREIVSTPSVSDMSEMDYNDDHSLTYIPPPSANQFPPTSVVFTQRPVFGNFDSTEEDMEFNTPVPPMAVTPRPASLEQPPCPSSTKTIRPISPPPTLRAEPKENVAPAQKVTPKAEVKKVAKRPSALVVKEPRTPPPRATPSPKATPASKVTPSASVRRWADVVKV